MYNTFFVVVDFFRLKPSSKRCTENALRSTTSIRAFADRNLPGVAVLPECLCVQKPRATREGKLRPSCCVVLVALSCFFGEMAGDGAVDIDLYAQVDEFEPDVTGQVIFWSLYVKERICFHLTVLQ